MSPVTGIRAVFLLDGLLISKWLPHLPGIQETLGLDVGQLGFSLAALPLGIIAALPFLGTSLLARFSEAVSITATLIWLAIASALPGLAWNMPSLMAALFLFGTGIGGVEVAMNTTADSVERRTGRRIMSSCHGLWSVGNIGGALLGAAMLSQHLPPNIALSMTAPFAVLAAIAIGPSLSPTRTEVEAGPALSLPSPSLLLLCLLPFCACVLEGAMADWAAVYLHLEQKVDGPLLGAGFTIFALVMAATRLSGDRLIDQFGPVFLASCCGVSGIAGLAVLWIATSTGVALLGFALMGLAASLVFPMSVTAAAQYPGAPAATNIAALSLICFGGYVIGPPVVGFIAGQVGLRSALLVLLPLAAMVVILAGLARPPASAATAKPTASLVT